MLSPPVSLEPDICFLRNFCWNRIVVYLDLSNDLYGAQNSEAKVTPETTSMPNYLYSAYAAQKYFEAALLSVVLFHSLVT